MGEIPSGEGSVFHFLDIFALGCGLEACSALFNGKSWWLVAGGVLGAIIFHLLGTNWSRIKPRVSPRFALALEWIARIAGNRLYRRVIYSVIVIAFLASIGLRVYRHYYPIPSQPASTQKAVSSSTGAVEQQPPQSVTPNENNPQLPSKTHRKREPPTSAFLGVHKPNETVVVPPNSSVVISSGKMPPERLANLDRMEKEDEIARAHLKMEPDKLTLHDLFLTDFSSGEEDNNTTSKRSGFTIRNNETGVITHIEYKVVRQLTLGTKVLLLYILPTDETAHLCVSLADHYNFALGDFLEGRTEAIKLPGDSEQMTTQDSVVSKRIFIYHEAYLSLQQVIDSSEAFKKKGITVILRSTDYLANKQLEAKLKKLEGKTR